MAIRITLSTDSSSLVTTNTPIGWNDAKHKIKRDSNTKGIFVNYITDLEFYGDAFDFLDNVLENGFCETVNILIENNDCDSQVYETEFQGVIALTQLTEYDVNKRILKTKILDTTFDAKINNNKSLKAIVDVGISKNGETITPCTPVEIDFYDPNDSYTTYDYPDRSCYRVYDCFRYIIEFMTDGVVHFASTIFENGGDYYNWMIIRGEELQTSSDAPEISFKELYSELNKKLDLGFAIEPDGYGGFYLRIEEREYFERDDSIIDLENVENIKMRFNQDELYSSIEVGGKETNDDITLSYPSFNIKTFIEESYVVRGQCNIDKQFDLVSSYVIDSNSIEDSLVNGEDKLNKKNFIVVTDGEKAIKYKEFGTPVLNGIADGTTTGKLVDSTVNFGSSGVNTSMAAKNITTGEITAITSVGTTTLNVADDIFTSGDSYSIVEAPFTYNHPLTNFEVLKRNVGGIPNTVTQYTGSQDNNFRAQRTGQTTITSFPYSESPVTFDDDSTSPNFDTNNNYDNANYYYEAPSGGVYGFESKMYFLLKGQLGSSAALITTNGSASTNGGFTSPSFYREVYSTSIGRKYKLTSEITVTTGSVKVMRSGVVLAIVTSSQTLELEILANSVTTEIYYQYDFEIPSYVRNLSIDSSSLDGLPAFTVNYNINLYDSSDNLITSYPNSQLYVLGLNEFSRVDSITASNTFNILSGYRVKMSIQIISLQGSNNEVRLYDGVSTTSSNYKQLGLSELNYFRTSLIEDGGGDVVFSDPNDYPIYIYEFEKALKFSDWKNIVNNPSYAIRFHKGDGNYIIGYRNEIEYERETGLTTFKLRSKQKINGNC